MYIEVSRATLHAALGALADVVDRREAIPVMTHVLITAAKKVVTVAATNGLNSATIELEGAAASEDYAGTLPYSTLAAFVRALPDGVLTLTTEKANHMRIESGDASMRVGGFDDRDFPPMPSPSGEVLSVVPAAHLTEVMRRLRKSTPTADNGSHGERAGMRIVLSASPTVSAASTDGYRMAVVGETEAQGTAMVIPVLAADALARFLAACQADAPVSTYMDENRAWWVSGARTFTAQLLDSRFPAVERVAKIAGGAAWVEVPREAFGRALGRVGVVIERSHQKVELKTDSDVLVVSLRTLRGDVVERLRLNSRGTEAPAALLFQHAYLAQMVDTFTGDTLRLEVAPKSSVSAAKWRSPDDTVPTILVMMPMRDDEKAAVA